MALRADARAPKTLLLGNFVVEENGVALEAVVVRPHSITILVLVPRGGKLQVPALGYGAWQLDGQPLAGPLTGADNPYEQFRQQKDALAAWLETQFEPDQANFQFITGLVVFGAPITYGPEVEGQLSQQPEGSLQLLGEVAQLSERLAQLAQPEINFSDADLSQWAQTLAEEPADDLSAAAPATAAPLQAEPQPARSFWRRAWGWLGAEDIPEDPPYGHSATQAAASSAEKQRLERVQQQAQAQVQQQLRAMEAREAERERRMEELRAQLAQAPLVTTETQALRERLAAESQEKAALENAIRASRTESDSRNRDLDTKIKQLSQLIEQLNNQAATSASVARATFPEPRGNAAPLRAAAGYRRVRAWRRRLPTAVGVAGLLGLGAWGVSHLTAGPPAPYQENGKWGLADASGKAISAAKYSAVGPVQQQRAVVEEAGTYGVIDDAGKEVVAPAYDALNSYAEGYARVRVGDTYTFVDAQGQEFADYYFNALDFAEGLAAVLDNRGWHYISGPAPESPTKPPVLFKEAYSFHKGLARVRLADGYTYITKDYLKNPAEGTAPFGRYEAATDFEDGKAHVTQKGRRFVIDTDGDPVQ